MLVSQKRVLVVWWSFMQNCCYCYIFGPRFRPDPVRWSCRRNKLSHGKRSLVKEKNTRTVQMFRIQVLFRPTRCHFQRHDTQVHNLTTVTCLENPAKAGISTSPPRGCGRWTRLFFWFQNRQFFWGFNLQLCFFRKTVKLNPNKPEKNQNTKGKKLQKNWRFFSQTHNWRNLQKNWR